MKQSKLQASTMIEDLRHPMLASTKLTVQKPVGPVQPNPTLLKIQQNFDFVERMKTLVVGKRPTAESGAFDLVRLLSMCWVVMAHQFSQRGLNLADDLLSKYKITREANDWNITFMQQGFYAVDFFLFMGGFVGIISLKRIVFDFKNEPRWKLPILYVFLFVKRYARILPTMGVVILFTVCVLPIISLEYPTNQYIGAGKWPEMFWQSWTLFYGYDISAGPKTLNCGWFWYLTVDFQCFLLVPIILMCAMVNRWLGIGCSVSLLVASISYGMWQSMSVPIYGTMSDPNWMGKYYFNPLARACVYFCGTTVALMTLPSDKPAPKPQVTTNRPDQVTPKVIVGTGNDYEVRPTETEHSKISKTRRVGAAKGKLFLIGAVCLVIVLGNFYILHYYFQIGRSPTLVPSLLLNALYTTFGKIIFVTAVMALLITISHVNKEFPKTIANNATIQLIGNLSFSIYCWHYAILFWSCNSNQTNTPYLDYYYYGCFMWIFVVTLVPACWTSLVIEFPLGDLWRLVEAPALRIMKGKREVQEKVK
jgi:peptidoglycan/LPS O-acetylase OafA/YrhL